MTYSHRNGNDRERGANSGKATSVADSTPGKHTLTESLPTLQAKSLGQAQTPPDSAAPGADDAGTPLLPTTRVQMERALATDFGDIRVFQGPRAGALHARAYAQGNELHFAPGEYRPGTPDGDRLIAHELAHVVQQRAGRVAGNGVVDDAMLEAEADRASESAVAGPAEHAHPAGGSVAPAERRSGSNASAAAPDRTVQRKGGEPPQVASDVTKSLHAAIAAGDLPTVVHDLDGPPDVVREIFQKFGAAYPTEMSLVAQLTSWKPAVDHVPGAEVPLAQLKRAGIDVPAIASYSTPDHAGRYGATDLSIRSSLPQGGLATPGTSITYQVVYPPAIQRQDPAFTFAWYCLNDPVASANAKQPEMIAGPTGSEWTATWAFAGVHTVVCRTTQDNGPARYVDFAQVVYPQSKAIDVAFAQLGAGMDPAERIRYLTKYVSLLAQTQKGYPLEAAAIQKTIDQVNKEIQALQAQLDSSGATTHTRRMISAVHVAESGQVTPLQVLLASPIGTNATSAPVPSGVGGTWTILDITGPSDDRLHGTYPGSGATSTEAISNAVKAWQNDNRYPLGTIKLQVPMEFVGAQIEIAPFHTGAKNAWGKFSDFLNAVGLVAGMVALATGVVTALLPIPGSQLVSAAIWTSILATSFGVGIDLVQQLQSQHTDSAQLAMDVLTLAGNLLGAGALATRGATVIFGGVNSQMARGVLIGGQLLTTTGQAAIMSAEYLTRLDQISSLGGQARTDALVQLLESAVLSGGLLIISTHSLKAELEVINRGRAAPVSDAELILSLEDPEKTYSLTRSASPNGDASVGSAPVHGPLPAIFDIAELFRRENVPVGNPVSQVVGLSVLDAISLGDQAALVPLGVGLLPDSFPIYSVEWGLGFTPWGEWVVVRGEPMQVDGPATGVAIFAHTHPEFAGQELVASAGRWQWKDILTDYKNFVHLFPSTGDLRYSYDYTGGRQTVFTPYQVLGVVDGVNTILGNPGATGPGARTIRFEISDAMPAAPIGTYPVYTAKLTALAGDKQIWSGQFWSFKLPGMDVGGFTPPPRSSP